jgi:UDP-glucose 4-epimerase
MNYMTTTPFFLLCYTSARPLPYEFGPRREGDIAVCYADPTKAREDLGWAAKRNLGDMCKDLWTWQSTNPNGYSGSDGK